MPKSTSLKLPRYVGPQASLPGQKMSQAEIKARFDAETAAAYSQRTPRWLPEYEYAMSLVLKVLAAYLPASARIVDLGAGTGKLARRVLKAWPDCHVTLVDFSQTMLGEAPHLLAGFEGRYQTMLEDLWRVDLPAGRYDGVIASYALHHGRGEAAYRDLYGKIWRWLEVPGVFVCCDVVEGDAPAIAELNEAGWHGFMQKRGLAAGDIERVFANYRREDSPLALRRHLDLLMQAGFSAADVVWKRFNFAVYVGIKA